MGFERKKLKNPKNLNNEEVRKLRENCKNLLHVNMDHAYATPFQNAQVKSNKKKDISEEELEPDDTVIPVSNEKTVNLINTKERSLSPLKQTVETETKSICSEEVETEIKNDLFKENIESPEQIVCTPNVDIENVNNHANIESIFLKEEIVEASLESTGGLDSKATDDGANIKKNEYVKYTKSTANSSTIKKGSLPEICILCATTNMSRKNYTLIIHFAEMIKDLSGVDILNSNVSPIACSICFKYVLEMWNLKQQIITADKFIKEKIPKQLGINLISTFDSRNVPKPKPFEYINLRDQNLIRLNTLNTRKERLCTDNFENRTTKMVKNKSFSKQKVKRSKRTKIDEVTLVPIEDILKDNENNDNNRLNQDCTITQECTKCRKAYKNNNLRGCNCDKRRKDKFVCSVCGKHYPFLRSLKRHEMVHKAKRYVCGMCNKAFHLKLYLTRHIKKHSLKKPFQCSYCNKRFSTAWNLSQHKRLHTNSLPYKCTLCPAAYRYNITLKNHIRMSHTANEFSKNLQNDNL